MSKVRQHPVFRLMIPFVVASIFLFPLVGAVAQLTRGHAKFFEFKCAPLQGLGQRDKPSSLRAKRWTDGTFQKDFEEWFSSNFGARVLMVRTNNEISQRLFGITSSGILVDAKNNLYTGGYLKDYFHNCTDKERVEVSRLTSELAELQQLLRKRGIAFVYLVTPSKAAIRPASAAPLEPQPASYRVYDELIAQLKAHNIHYVDGHGITCDLEQSGKSTFPQGGLHWTEVTAAQTLNEVLKSINGQLNRVAFDTISIGETSQGKPEPVESDLAGLMNMLQPLTNYQCTHGQLSVSERPPERRSSLVIEGSSFCGQLTTIADKTKLCNRLRHYFYFTRALHSWPDGRHLENFEESAVDWDGDILNADAIVVENNEALKFDHNEKFVSAAIARLKEQSKLAKRATGTL